MLIVDTIRQGSFPFFFNAVAVILFLVFSFTMAVTYLQPSQLKIHSKPLVVNSGFSPLTQNKFYGNALCYLHILFVHIFKRITLLVSVLRITFVPPYR